MTAPPFRDVLDGPDELRAVYRAPSETSLRKEIDRLDEHCRAFIAHAPLAVLSTAGADGRCDVSPKGGPPGFVAVLDDHHLAVPDLTGNNRLDSLSNVVENPFVALLFLVPGLDETLRVNGRGVVTRDEEVLDACAVMDRRPKAALAVEVETAYLHCAKALKRSEVWHPERWPDRSGLPTPACMLSDHIGLPDLTPDVVEAALQESYTTRLWG
jgi:PPOX class probable FMN-dependent enzyme